MLTKRFYKKSELIKKLEKYPTISNVLESDFNDETIFEIMEDEKEFETWFSLITNSSDEDTAKNLTDCIYNNSDDFEIEGDGLSVRFVETVIVPESFPYDKETPFVLLLIEQK